MNARAGVLACAACLPETHRRTDDLLYAHVDTTPNRSGQRESDLFTGAFERRFLGEGEDIETFMRCACRQALSDAGLTPHHVDRLYGYASVPTYATPNSLYLLHERLGLRSDALVVPINSEFSNFLLGLLQAHEAITAGTCRHALVVSGSNWTRHLDFRRGHAQAASDGAGAAVVGPEGAFSVIDHATHTAGAYYESMTMGVRIRQADEWAGIPVNTQGVPVPTYSLDPDMGVEVYQTLMRDGLPRLVSQLMDRHDIRGEDIALITHQGSRELLDHWRHSIQPSQHLETLATFGNLTNATYPVNLAHHFQTISAPYLAIAAVGTGFHLTALLLRNHHS
ncbi:3-oxoacyl-ACP synthase III family protein [Streptomyces microflavus]|uniref:3-oxoacyl-ACP synthase III family protein n=1 Tax=Streptomyces TaxID=1883 RepID=UPI00117C79C3|nr:MULTISPECIES: 3-oxoacyl-[acyl-carrier-protein] synthase III C-terminal domain-containing protein [unclassified Streptomyces]